jgi:RNA polymerase sigma-70 factor (ECF subfamily)
MISVEVSRSDRELLQAWRDGDADAGEALLARHFTSLYRFFANKVGDDTDDLVQRTFLACIESRDALRDDASFRAYMFTVARHQLFSYLRKRIGHGDASALAQVSVADVCPSPSRIMGERDEQRLLLAALRALPLELQILLELYYWEELPVAELAHTCGIPQGTVRSRLHRARTLLEEELARTGASRETRDAAIRDLDTWARALRDRARTPKDG